MGGMTAVVTMSAVGARKVSEAASAAQQEPAAHAEQHGEPERSSHDRCGQRGRLVAENDIGVASREDHAP
jgi:hypothetical protein